MKLNNGDRVREYARKNSVRLWEIAIFLDVSESSITRALRCPTEEVMKMYISVIDTIKRGREND